MYTDDNGVTPKPQRILQKDERYWIDYRRTSSPGAIEETRWDNDQLKPTVIIEEPPEINPNTPVQTLYKQTRQTVTIEDLQKPQEHRKTPTWYQP